MKETAMLMIFVAALFIGTCMGCLCLYAAMKCMQKNRNPQMLAAAGGFNTGSQ